MPSRTALVTGANKGIGYAIAAQLADAGLVVYLGARDTDRGRRATDALAGEGRVVRFVPLDVTDQASVDAAADIIGGETGQGGAGRLDVLVNNAGISVGHEPPSRTSAEQMTTALATNVAGVVRVTNVMLPLLRASDAGAIVNLTSDLGSLHYLEAGDHPMGAFPLLMAYNTSKTALNAVTLHYAKELAESGISVHAISPGYVATDLNGNSGTATTADGARVPVAVALDPTSYPDLLVSDTGTGDTVTPPW